MRVCVCVLGGDKIAAKSLLTGQRKDKESSGTKKVAEELKWQIKQVTD